MNYLQQNYLIFNSIFNFELEQNYTGPAALGVQWGIIVPTFQYLLSDTNTRAFFLKDMYSIDTKRISKRGSVLKVRGGCYNYRFKFYK